MTVANQSFVRHTGDGTTTTFSLSVSGDDIGYLRTEDIHAYVDGVEVDATIEFSSPHLVNLATAPEDGAYVLLRREMPSDSPYANFERGNVYSPKALNSTFLQQLYLLQQLLDGFLPDGYYEKQNRDMGGNRIINAGEAIDATDYVIKSTVDGIEARVTLAEGKILVLQSGVSGLTARVTTAENTLVNHNTRISTLESSFSPNDTLLCIPFTSTEGQTDFVVPYTITDAFCVISGAFQTKGNNSYSIVAPNIVRVNEPLPAGIDVNIIVGLSASSFFSAGMYSPDGSHWLPSIDDTGLVSWSKV